MKTCWFAAALVASAVACGVGTQACSSHLPPPGTAGAPPGGRVPSAAGTAASSLPSPGEAASVLAADLSGFVPLLSLPELGAAAQACSVEEYAACANLVEAHIRRSQFSLLEEPRWYFLLGTLREKAGDLLSATQAYERATESAWPLSDYASLGLGRALVALADWEGADRALASIPDNAGTYVEARGLLAEIACRQEVTGECLGRARVFRALPDKPPSWASQAWRIAALLVDQLAPEAPRVPPASAATVSAASAAGGVEETLGVLGYVRSLLVDAPKTAIRFDGAGLERRLLDLLPPALAARERKLSPKEQLARAEAQANAGRDAEAAALSEALLAELGSGAFGPIACQARLIQGRALFDLKQRTRAESCLRDLIRECKSEDLRASALYISGRSAFQEGRYSDSERLFARLEREMPRHRLADDARLYRAQVQREIGAEERVAELLTSMPDAYPQGDMVLDGLFLLALGRMEKGDWPGAASVLARSLQLSGADGAARGPDTSGRERYFQARALVETGEVERGLAEYERIIEELPLSYYMLNAYSRLSERDYARAQRALDGVQRASSDPPFRIEHRPEFDQPGFLRALELFRQSDIDSARRELQLLNLLEPGTSPSVLWGVALLYARAGSARLSHALPRWQLRDWLERWPVGPWKQAWELAFPRPHIEAVTEEAKNQSVDPALIYAVMREESAFDHEAVSAANAYGLMQLITPTAKRFGKEAGLPYDRRALTTPRVNIALGIRVLSNYQSWFPSDPLLAIPGYNAGPGRPRQWAKALPSVDFDLWVELIPYRETRRYTKRVLASRGAYAFLYYQPEQVTPDNDPLRLPRRLSSDATH